MPALLSYTPRQAKGHALCVERTQCSNLTRATKFSSSFRPHIAPPSTTQIRPIMDSPHYHKFDVLEVTYKIVNNQRIHAYILVPKALHPGKHPILAAFHGGFFVAGSALNTDALPKWLLDYCLLHHAIIVAPNYRLIPESSGSDMLDDIASFWDSIRNHLPRALAMLKPGIHPDLDKIIAYGGSAGGGLAVQSGLTQPPDFIKAVIAAYPALGMGSRSRSSDRESSTMGYPTIPPYILENFLTNIKPGEIVTHGNAPERTAVAVSLVQQGRMQEFFGSDDRLYPSKVLEKVDSVAFILILHGKDDSVVPVSSSVEFARIMEERFGREKVELRIEAGGHGFDSLAELDMPWLNGGLERVTELWIGPGEA